VRVWTTSSGHQAVVCTHEGPARTAFFSQDGRLIATAGADGFVHLLHAVSGEKLMTLKGCGNVVDAAFSSNGKRLATVSLESGLTLWSTEKGGKEREYSYHSTMLATNGDGTFSIAAERLLCLAISENDEIVTGSESGGLQLWPDDDEGKPAHVSGHGAAVNSIALSPDAQWILSSSNDGSSDQRPYPLGLILLKPIRDK